MSMLMAIVDFIPVILFLLSALMLQRDLYDKMSKGAFALFAAGTFMVVTAGIYKATWKLLYAAGVCDFTRLNMSFMPMQATGFFLTAAALIALLFFKQEESGRSAAYSVAALPAVFSGTLIFVGMMCLGIGVICAVLSVFAVRLKKRALIPLFALVFVGMLAMGYLSSKDFAEPAMNWLAEGVNIAAQSLLLAGTVSLHRAGLRLMPLKKEKSGCAA